MNTPLVSIVMPAYNADRFIAESINSALQQTYQNWELLIIEDASTDETCQIVQDFSKKDERIILYKLPTNQGTGFARNIGIKASKGDFISFLDADDYWEPKKLQIQVDFMLKNNVKVSFSSYELMDKHGKRMFEMVTALETVSFSKLLKANYIGNLTGMYNARVLGKTYCPPIRKRQDWAMWLLILKKAGGATGIQESLAKYRVRKNSLSGNKWEMLHYNYKVYRKVLGFSTLKSSNLFCKFLMEQFFVKSRQIVVLKE